MKRLVLCGIVILSVVGLMVGTVYGWRGRGWGGRGWGGRGWGGHWRRPGFGFDINFGRPRYVARPVYVPGPYPTACPSQRFCEKNLDNPVCVRCYPALYQ